MFMNRLCISDIPTNGILLNQMYKLLNFLLTAIRLDEIQRFIYFTELNHDLDLKIFWKEQKNFPLVQWLEGTRLNVYYENECKPSKNADAMN